MIVLFDGVCNLCNRWVDRIVRNNPGNTIQLAAQQSDAGQRLLREHGLADLAGQTMLVVDDGRVFTRSTGALKIVRALRAPWPLLYALIIVPPFLRNAVYDWVARNRYRWFGKRDTCRVPTPEERARFLE